MFCRKVSKYLNHLRVYFWDNLIVHTIHACFSPPLCLQELCHLLPWKKGPNGLVLLGLPNLSAASQVLWEAHCQQLLQPVDAVAIGEGRGVRQEQVLDEMTCPGQAPRLE